jgi:APA family basic amino acid/polyamine antiporter
MLKVLHPMVGVVPEAEDLASASGTERKGFRPELGFWSLTFLIVGSMIGSGIFFRPGDMLRDAGSVPMVLLAWLGGAAIALCGGLMFAELGAAFPRAGGQYVFLREGAGRLPAFLFSWTGFTVVQSGTIAAVAVAFSAAIDRFLDRVFGVSLPGSRPCLGQVIAGGDCKGFQLPPWGEGFLAVALILGLTVLNYVGVRRAALVNNIATVAKVAALIVVMLLLLPARDAGNFSGSGTLTTPTAAGFGLALASSLFAYDGFAQATFVAGEVKDARRTLPRAIITAGVGVAAIYILATASVFHALPAGAISHEALADTRPITVEALENVFAGPVGLAVSAGLLAAIAVSTLGTVNAYVLASPRIYHSVARDGEFPRPFGVLSRFRTPTYGLWYGAVWAGVLALSGGFDTLANLTVFGLYVFYLLTVVAYFVLRARQPAAFDSFKVPLRPFPAVLFGLGAVYVLGSYALKDLPALAHFTSPLDVLTNTTLFGLLLIGSGLVVYAGLRWSKRRAAAGPPPG